MLSELIRQNGFLRKKIVIHIFLCCCGMPKIESVGIEIFL